MSTQASKHILVVNSSPNGAQSVSRQVADAALKQLQSRYPGAQVTFRDLDKSPLPHLTGETVAAFFTPPANRSPELQQAIKLSDAITDELLAADIIVIGAPMWNFNVPSVLKAWIDHIVRAGRTFSMHSGGYEGLVKGKTVYLALSQGGRYGQAPMKALDFQESYLRGVLGFLGITDVHALVADGTGSGAEGVQKALAAVRARVETVVQTAA